MLVTTSDQNAKVWRMPDISLQNELHCAGQRWVWDAAFTGDSQYVLTGKLNFVYLLRIWNFT